MDFLKDLTIGIEEEYQIVDKESRELTSFVSDFLEQGAILFRDQVKPEFLQSQIEVGSKVCKNVHNHIQSLPGGIPTYSSRADSDYGKFI